MTLALLFPGQGSQSVGMGKELYTEFKEARLVFDEVDDALNENLSDLIFEGPLDVLTLTENAQPALMATSIAILRVLEKEYGFDVARDAAFVAGHSLGEYTALTAARALTLTDTARLLRVRGQAMQRSVPTGNGAMAALLGIDRDTAEDIVKEAAGEDICSVANDNAPGQVVVSGAKAAVERAVEIAKTRGAKRSVLLQVSAPFHCPLMGPAAGIMAEALAVVKMRRPVVPLVANMTAQAVTDPEAIKQLLVNQVTGAVRWRESIEYLTEQGVKECFELGAGKVLAGLNRRIAPEMRVTSIGQLEDVRALTKAEAA